MASVPQPLFPALGESPLPADDWEARNARRLHRLALALVVVGLVWRFTRYLMRFPVWGDEAMLLVNYFSKGYLDLLGPIDNCQVAPILFHWIELTAVRWLGTSELAVRFPSFLACLGSLAIFWRLTGLTLPPLARTIAVSIFAVSIWPATMGSLTKPYASDLFFSLVLLTPAVAWLRDPLRLRPLVLLVVVAPVALIGSYPAVFVAGGVSLTLLSVIWRLRDRKTITWFVLYNLLLTGTFAAHYLVVGRAHLASSAGNVTTAEGMHRYWESSFPPLAPFAFLKWFLFAHTGQVAAYPLGAANGGSILTVLMTLVGVYQLHRRGQYGLVAIFAATLGLGFVAAVLHKYPYGASCRLAQHLAPFWCMLAGLGVAVLIGRLSASRSRWQATLIVCGLLAAIGIGGSIRDIVRPFRDENALWARNITGELMSRAGDDPVISAQPLRVMDPVFTWQLGSRGEHVIAGAAVDWRKEACEHASLWIFSFGLPTHDEPLRLAGALEQSGQSWRCVEFKPSLLSPARRDEGIEHCRMYHWVREPQ